MQRRHVIWIIAAALVIVLGVLGSFIVAPALAHNANDYDMVGMLKDIDRTNREIGKANDGILNTLGQVKQRSERVKNVSHELDALHSGLKEQQAVLDKLKVITSEQAELSRALETLTAGVGPNTKGLARTASEEAAAVEQMGAITSRLAGQLSEIGEINQSSAAKLDRAERYSALILSRMP